MLAHSCRALGLGASPSKGMNGLTAFHPALIVRAPSHLLPEGERPHATCSRTGSPGTLLRAGARVLRCYTTYKPPGGAPEWKVKAEKEFDGKVTIMINDTQALKGQYAIVGEQEVKGKYEGRDISMILKRSHEGRVTVYECLLYAEGNQIGFFRW